MQQESIANALENIFQKTKLKFESSATLIFMSKAFKNEKLKQPYYGKLLLQYSRNNLTFQNIQLSPYKFYKIIGLKY